MGGTVGPRQHGLLAALLVGRANRRAGQPALVALSAAVILAACATTESVAPARQPELMTRAQECQRAHPEIERWEVDRFGHVTAYYRWRQARRRAPIRLQLHPPAVGAGGGRRDDYTSASGGGAASGGVGSPHASGTSWWNRLDSRM